MAAGEQTITIEHDEIRAWVEGANGVPSKLRGTGNDPSDPAVLRIDFSGDDGDPALEPIEWDAWFEEFTDQKLAAMYVSAVEGDTRSPFFKLVSARNVF